MASPTSYNWYSASASAAPMETWGSVSTCHPSLEPVGGRELSMIATPALSQTSYASWPGQSDDGSGLLSHAAIAATANAPAIKRIPNTRPVLPSMPFSLKTGSRTPPSGVMCSMGVGSAIATSPCCVPFSP